MTAGSSSVPKRPVRLVGTARTAVPGVPGVCLKLQGKSVFPWERLTSMRVTVGPYSPERIGNSRTVPAVLTRYLQFYLQSSQVTNRAARYPELPGKLRHLINLQSPPVRPWRLSGRTPRYSSVPGALSGTAVRPVWT